ncbi:MAG: efflux RND transporter periplasmic adaptor subunit, partial [Myxococcales bacterium]|nr:efflux RND transporter periplasmic adaptor subunit [Myxococcales bacterium]
VDESDIGSIKEGQPAYFTVQSYPNERFTGTVKQVRLQSTTLNNVVNYTAVLEVENPDSKLLPGMTATVQFLTGSQRDVVLVPNAALRFTPTEEMLSQAGAAGAPSAAAPPIGRSDAATPRVVGARTRGAAQTSQQKSGTLWYIGADSQATEAKVLIGLSDGRMTAVQSPAIGAGTQLILGLTSGSAQTATSTTRTNNPLQPQSAPRGPGGF